MQEAGAQPGVGSREWAAHSMRGRAPRGAGLARSGLTPAGRARLSLIAALGNVPGWLSAAAPRPSTMDGQIDAQIQQLLDPARTDLVELYESYTQAVIDQVACDPELRRA